MFTSVQPPSPSKGGMERCIGTASRQEIAPAIATGLRRKKRWTMLAVLSLLFVQCSANGQSWTELEQSRWNKAVVRKEKLHYVQAICAEIKRNQARYQAVERATNVPW